MPWYKIKENAGPHVEKDDSGVDKMITWKDGAFFSELEDLETRYVNKFEKVPPPGLSAKAPESVPVVSEAPSPAPAAKAPETVHKAVEQASPPAPETSKTTAAPEPPTEDEQEDVSEDFKDAAALELKVVRKGHDYYIYDGSTCVSKSPLKRKDVTAFLKKMKG